eukprot:417164-Amphidinium_carterae.1
MDMDDYFVDRFGGWESTVGLSVHGWPMLRVPPQWSSRLTTCKSQLRARNDRVTGNDEGRMNEEHLMTEGGTEGALVGSWCDWLHRMFKEASAKECRMELTV